MLDYKEYSLFLCIFVFVILVAFFGVLLTLLMKSAKKLIAYGDQDEEILSEFQKKQNRKKKTNNIGAYIFNMLLGVVFLGIFLLAMCMNVQDASISNTVPTLRVVQSSSMATRFFKNEYLEENDLNDQFAVHDIVLTYKMPDEFDLELYDIVVYDMDGVLLIHRIVQIEEPNADHPDCRHFRLQGDAVEYPDRFPVLYEQMRGIYRGENIPFLGSFVAFLQSFAGWLCMGLLIGTMFLSPALDKYLENRRAERLAILLNPPCVDEEESYNDDDDDDEWDDDDDGYSYIRYIRIPLSGKKGGSDEEIF